MYSLLDYVVAKERMQRLAEYQLGYEEPKEKPARLWKRWLRRERQAQSVQPPAEHLAATQKRFA